jgi:hypothetical protein
LLNDIVIGNRVGDKNEKEPILEDHYCLGNDFALAFVNKNYHGGSDSKIYKRILIPQKSYLIKLTHYPVSVLVDKVVAKIVQVAEFELQLPL